MAHAYALRETGGNVRFNSIAGAAVFVPCLAIWTVGVLCMLPITALAFPVQYFFEHRPKLHGDIVTGLVIAGAVNALLAPLLLLYFLYR